MKKKIEADLNDFCGESLKSHQTHSRPVFGVDANANSLSEVTQNALSKFIAREYKKCSDVYPLNEVTNAVHTCKHISKHISKHTCKTHTALVSHQLTNTKERIKSYRQQCINSAPGD